MSDDKLQIRTFFSRFVRVANLKDDDDIFALGLVNSLFAMQLILWVESEFRLEVGDGDLRLSNFNTVDAIAGFIARRRAVPATG